MPSIKSEEAVNRLVKAAIVRAPVEYRWRDRGGMSSESHLREQCRKYVKKANRDFAGLKDRWVKDPLWRANMIDNGWDWDSLDFIQKVADTPALPNKGRTREQRESAAGWYAAVTTPGAQPDVAMEHEVHQNILSQTRAAHRRRDTEYWQNQRQQGDYQPRASLVAAYTRYPQYEPGETRADRNEGDRDADAGRYPYAAAAQDHGKGAGKTGGKGKGKGKSKGERFEPIVWELYGKP